ncbi:hypothetical protein FOZ60_002335 [Perkinsus olseni]|uniref:Large ribosomal subunit protein bL21m n=1 Tax=Perkinsus olseni TaxID=32597 RepID=A0A7J6PK46_PEROL|nr:hypothetical protein FOZ60_002335 [Perkinsus olseni]
MSRAATPTRAEQTASEKKATPEAPANSMDAITVFTFFWSQLMLLQCVKLFFIFKSSRTVQNAIPLVSLAIVDFLALVKPRCRYVTMTSLLVGFVVIFVTGHYSNHIFADIALGSCIFLTYKSDRSEWVNRATWAMRAMVIALYFVTGIDKMNEGWASHEYSCCILMFGGFVGLPLFKFWSLLRLAFLLLSFSELPRGNTSGSGSCVSGVLFSTVFLPETVSPMSVYPFTMAMAPMYTFVLPEQAALVANTVVNWLNAKPILRWGAFLGLFAAFVSAWPMLMASRAGGYPPYGLWAFAAVWSLCSCVYLLCVTFWPAPKSDVPVKRVYPKRSLLGSIPWIFICCLAGKLRLALILAFVTIPPLAMFSNLRTEGGQPNSHVFGDDFDFLGYQRDYVTVHSTNIPSIEWAQVDLGQLFTSETKRFLTEYNISSEFWITPPFKGWPYPPTREFVPYSTPFVELRRRIAEMKDFPKDAYINYTRTQAPPQLRLAKVWDIFGVAHPMADLDKPASQDFVYNSTVRGTGSLQGPGDTSLPLGENMKVPHKVPKHPLLDTDQNMNEIVTYADLKLRWNYVGDVRRNRMNMRRKWKSFPNRHPKREVTTAFVQHDRMPFITEPPKDPPPGMKLDLENAFVVFLSGKWLQHKATVGDIIQTERIKRKQAGDQIVFGSVLLVGTKDWTLMGKPVIPYAKVHCTIEQQTLTKDQVSFIYKPKRRWFRFRRVRYWVTMLRLDRIEVDPRYSEAPEDKPLKPVRLLDMWASRWQTPEELRAVQRDEAGTMLAEKIYDGTEQAPGHHQRRGLVEAYRFYPDPQAPHQRWHW